jgi:membrane protease YdiL (CAAX protease family)
MKWKPLIVLLLLVPAPSLGVFAGMICWPDENFGKILFSLSKLWAFSLPLVWHLLVDRERLSLSPPARGGFGMGILTGCAISGVILGAYLFIGPFLLDESTMRRELSVIGLDNPFLYIGAALYWILINSVLEEYLWRWFVFSKCAILAGPKAGILLSALFFTLHHYFALGVYLDRLAALLCSLGVFVGGVIWSWLYARYQSIWPAYVSHAIVDLAIFGIGAYILFGL